MCDYSLEMYQSRPARAGERYETHRFSSGSIGFISPGAPEIAVCMSCDAKLQISDLPLSLQQTFGLGATETVTFARLEHGPHHDGVHFANGTEMSLQRLGLGISAHLIDEVMPVTVPSRRELTDA